MIACENKLVGHVDNLLTKFLAYAEMAQGRVSNNIKKEANQQQAPGNWC